MKDKTLRLLVSGLFGIALGMVVWMFTLPAGFISKRGMAIAVAAAVFLTFLYYKFLIPFFMRHYRDFKLNWLVITVVLALLTGIAYQKVIAQQPLFFPFTPKQTIQLTSQAESLSFRPIECELMTLYSGDFAFEGDLERVNSTVMILHGKGASLTWRGWPGSTCRLTLVNPDVHTDVEVLWNGQHHEIKGLSAGLEEYPFTIDFTVPFSTRLTVSSILFLVISAVVLLLACAILLFSGENNNREEVVQQSTPKWQIRLLALLLGILILVLLMRLLISNNPYTHFPGRDQGVFLYIGEGLLKGQTPYLDTWDHKGPLIYFINAFGKLLDPTGEWGVYSLMIVFLLAAVVSSYFILRKRAGMVPLLGGLAVFLGLILNLGAFDNLVELYALPFYALGLLAVNYAVEKRNPNYMLLYGATAALAFSLRPNLISVFAVGGIYWLVEDIRRRGKIGRGLLLASIGAIIVLLPMVIFFGSRGALPDLYDQMFRFNFLYASVTGIEIWEKLTEVAPTSLPVVIGGLICIFFTTGFNWNRINDNRDFLLTICTLSFGLEFVLSRLSGYDFPHYSMPLLLIGSILLVCLLETIGKSFSIGYSATGRLAVQVTAGALVFGVLLYQVLAWIKLPETMRSEEVLQPEIQETLTRRPTLLVWGAETQINYLLGRDSPTRYAYQYPLLIDQYCSTEMENEFLEDVIRALPVILDTSNGNPWVPPLDADKRDQTASDGHFYGNLECLNGFLEFVQRNYSPIYTMPGHRWTIYLPNDTGMAKLVDD